MAQSLKTRIPLKRSLLSQERLQELFRYDPETGALIRRIPIAAEKAGTLAGSYNCHGYRAIRADNERHFAHRIIWLYVYGRWPEQEIDYRNGDRCDNRLSNLRVASRSQQLCNSKQTKGLNKLRGTHCYAPGRWRAQIAKDGKSFHLGVFGSEEEAHEAYCKKARELFGDFAHAPSLKL